MRRVVFCFALMLLPTAAFMALPVQKTLGPLAPKVWTST